VELKNPGAINLQSSRTEPISWVYGLGGVLPVKLKATAANLSR
jgi:hypothetical protein